MSTSTPAEKSKQWPQVLAALSSTLLAISTGLHFCWSSPIKFRLDDLCFPVNSKQLSYIVMIASLGYLIGCPMTAVFIDSIGRKYAIWILAFPQILAWLLIANSTNMNMIYIARLCSGITEGGAIMCVSVYIGEISEPSIRGALGMVYATAIMFGCLLINIYGSFVNVRSAAYISISFPLLFLISFIWMPESPYFCLIKGDVNGARKSLKKLRRMNNVDEELNQLTVDVDRQISVSGSFSAIFTTKSNMKGLFIIFGLRTIQQFSGGASLNFYNQHIFSESGNEYILISTIVYHASLVVVGAAASLVIDRMGRKVLLMLSATGSGICMFCVGFYFCLQHYKQDVSSFSWIVAVFLVLYTITRGFGLMPIPTLLTGEIFSVGIKAKASCITTIYLALCISVSSKLFHWLQEEFGMHMAFFFFSGVCFLGVFFVYFFVPETKGKTLEEIQQQLRGHLDYRV